MAEEEDGTVGTRCLSPGLREHAAEASPRPLSWGPGTLQAPAFLLPSLPLPLQHGKLSATGGKNRSRALSHLQRTELSPCGLQAQRPLC